MAFNTNPVIGQWYKNRETGDMYEVVASDEAEGFVEVQFFASEIEEFDLDTWKEFDLIEIPEPEDWSGPFELTRDDVDYSDYTFQPENWSGALTGIEPDIDDWY